MKRGRMVLLNLLLGKLPVSDQGGTASEAPPLTPMIHQDGVLYTLIYIFARFYGLYYIGHLRY